MSAPQSTVVLPDHSPRALSLRVQEDIPDLIDQAARTQGRSRSEFMIGQAHHRRLDDHPDLDDGVMIPYCAPPTNPRPALPSNRPTDPWLPHAALLLRLVSPDDLLTTTEPDEDFGADDDEADPADPEDESLNT